MIICYIYSFMTNFFYVDKIVHATKYDDVLNCSFE